MTKTTLEGPHWGDLETRGFVVVRAFFSAAEIHSLLTDFKMGAPPSTYPFGFKIVGRAALDRVWPKLASVVRRIKDTTKVDVDTLPFLSFSHYIVTELTERTAYFHQDFDLYYKLTRDHEHYLNFYAPLVKPDRKKSNLTFVPLDVLRARCPSGWERLVGSGGHRLASKGGSTEVFGNYGALLDRGADKPLFTLPIDIEELGMTPELEVSDLLVLRGDVIHKTQDAETKRVSVSLRVTSSKKIIRRDRLDPIDETARDPGSKLTAALHHRLDALGRDEMTVEEFLATGGDTRRL